jgi:hypothetical protein
MTGQAGSGISRPQQVGARRDLQGAAAPPGQPSSGSSSSSSTAHLHLILLRLLGRRLCQFAVGQSVLRHLLQCVCCCR